MSTTSSYTTAHFIRYSEIKFMSRDCTLRFSHVNFVNIKACLSIHSALSVCHSFGEPITLLQSYLEYIKFHFFT